MQYKVLYFCKIISATPFTVSENAAEGGSYDRPRSKPVYNCIIAA